MIGSIPIYLWLGIVPLLIFAFSLIKPSRFTKNILPILVALLMLLLMIRLGMGKPYFFAGFGYVVLAMVIAIPPLAALLMALSGISALANRCSSWLGIPFSILNAAGCTGLIFGLWLAYFLRFIKEGHGIGDDILIYLKIGGGILSLVTLVYATVTWKKRLTRKTGDGA